MIFEYKNKKYELIMLCVTGSRMYGTHYEKGEHPLMPDYVSDYDYRGVFVPHQDEKLGLFKEVDQISPSPAEESEIELNDELIASLNKGGLNLESKSDIVLYEVRKFVKMATEQNPNILDLLFTDDDATLYMNSKGKQITDNKLDFLTKNVTKKFLGYAEQQLHRIKNHNKHIVKRPLHNEVIQALSSAYNEKVIDFNWINIKFSGQLAQFVSQKTQQEANLDPKLKSHISIGNFKKEYLTSMSMTDLNKYAKPQIINYITLKGLEAEKNKMSDEINVDGELITYTDLLNNKASFRKISNSLYNIFTGGNGFLSRNNDIKNVEPEKIGKFITHASVDKQKFKNDLEQVTDFWNWRVHRNPKRSALEEKFGYDTKHAGHLVRLMIGAKEIISEGTYTPRLNEKTRLSIKSVIEGKFTYNELLEKSIKLKENIIQIEDKGVLKEDEDMDINKINKMLLNISYLDEKKKKKNKLNAK
jgi:predicted nucleotidyltransferase